MPESRLFAAEYSADAMRIALADASDLNDDGNFESSIANAAILRLTRELTWIEETLAEIDAGHLRRGPELNLADRVLANAVSCAAAATHKAYDGMLLREALKSGMYDLHTARCGASLWSTSHWILLLVAELSFALQPRQTRRTETLQGCWMSVRRVKGAVYCRDAYRVQLGADAMHAEVIQTYVDASVRLVAPIAPHWADHIFRNVLKAGETVLTAGWPQLPPPDLPVKMAGEYVEKLIVKLRSAVDKKEAPPKKKKGDHLTFSKFICVALYLLVLPAKTARSADLSKLVWTALLEQDCLKKSVHFLGFLLVGMPTPGLKSSGYPPVVCWQLSSTTWPDKSVIFVGVDLATCGAVLRSSPCVATLCTLTNTCPTSRRAHSCTNLHVRRALARHLHRRWRLQ
jgi:hypothetical protein